MADAMDGVPQLKDRPLQFGGKTYTLRFAMIAMIAIKEEWKIEDDGPVTKRIGKRNVTDIPTLFWAALQTHHPELTLKAVTRMLDDAEPEAIAEAYKVVREAVDAGWQRKEKKPDAAAATQKT